jgi:hypothetical protein
MDLDPLRSFHHESKIVRNTFISIVLRLLSDFLSLKNDVNISLKSNKPKKQKNTLFLVFGLEEEQDPDSDQNVTDPEH